MMVWTEEILIGISEVNNIWEIQMCRWQNKKKMDPKRIACDDVALFIYLRIRAIFGFL
jgi:hypothetical protein